MNGFSDFLGRVVSAHPLALGGRLVISQRQPGLRVHAMLRQPIRR